MLWNKLALCLYCQVCCLGTNLWDDDYKLINKTNKTNKTVIISQICSQTTHLTVQTYCQFVPEHIVWQIHLVTWSSPKMSNCKASEETWKARPSSFKLPNLSLFPPKLYLRGLLSI